MGFPFRSEKLIRYLTGKFTLGGLLPNDGYLIGVPKIIHINDVSVGNVGIGLDPLQSFTLPAKSWKNGDILRVHYAGTFGANSDSKRIQVEIGGQVVHNTGLFATNGVTFAYYLDYLRQSADAIRATGQGCWGTIARDVSGTMAQSGLIFAIFNSPIAPADMDANDTIFRLQGESSTATNDNVLHRKTVLELIRNS